MNAKTLWRLNSVTIAISGFALLLFVSPSCSPMEGDALLKIEPVRITIHTNDAALSASARSNWNMAAAMTRKKLQALEARDPITMADCQKYFATNDPKNIEVVKSTLRKMDANFQRGKCQVQFFHRNDTPPLSIFLKSNQGADVFAYTTLGGQTMHAPSWKAHGYSPNTIVHEMSHMAAHTHDYGYSNTGDLYWTTEGECKKLTTHQLLRNADTYALFIEMDIPQVARSWKTTEAWRANR